MVARAEVIHQSISMLRLKYRCVSEIAAAGAPSPASLEIVGTTSELELRASDATIDVQLNPEVLEFIPRIRSGSFSNIGPQRYMEDEHICIDDLSAHIGSPFTCPTPCALYGFSMGMEVRMQQITSEGMPLSYSLKTSHKHQKLIRFSWNQLRVLFGRHSFLLIMFG